MASERKILSSSSPNTTDNISNSKRILLVDDEADVISLFKMVLEMNGFEVDAYTGEWPL
jgi:PleD family two-component response regulator